LSAILKALKKTERESRGPVRSLTFSKELDAKEALNHRARRSWLLRRLTAGFCLVVLLTAAAVLGFSYGPSFLRRGVFSTAPSEPQAGMEKQKRTSEPEVSVRSKETSAPSKESATDEGSIPLPSSGEPSPISQGILKPRTAAVTEESSFQENPVLELQAIVWSDDPESCFAVINGRIVRANGTVEGVNVIEINEDSVSLKQGDTVWKVRMTEEK